MFIAITLAFVTLPKVFANTINVTREITAPVDKVWKILSKRDSIKIYQFLVRNASS
jgi:uncharacterized protein YndB with AHSA1/START domain